MSRRAACLATCLCLLGAGGLAAQDASDSAAYRALTQTPLGAFTPALGAVVTMPRGAGPSVTARYGLQSFRESDYIHNFGGTAEVGVATGRLAVTLGRYNPQCPKNDCPGHLTLSAGYRQGLAIVALGRAANAAGLDIGLDVAAGYARPRPTLVSGSARMTFAFVPQGHGFRLFPYLTPGVGVGLTDQRGDTDAGMLPLLDIGVGLLAAGDHLAATAGASRVFMRDGNWVAGINLGWTFRR
jgi:hypothetical protein